VNDLKPMVRGSRMMLRRSRILKLWDVRGMMKLRVYPSVGWWEDGMTQARMVSRSSLGNRLLFSEVHWGEERGLVREEERRGYEKTWLLDMLVLLPILAIGEFPSIDPEEGRSGS
jgi:hypothetical protein